MNKEAPIGANLFTVKFFIIHFHGFSGIEEAFERTFCEEFVLFGALVCWK